MAKYMVIYNSSASASELMANASPEEMQASMAEWIAWKTEADKVAAVEFGLPLQAVGQVSPVGVAASHNEASGYSVIEMDSRDAVMDLLKTHPHLKREGATIDVLEMMPMPGM